MTAMPPDPSARGRGTAWVVPLAIIGAVATVTAAVVSLAGAVRMARTVVTPPTRRLWDIRVLGVSQDASTVRLARTAETELPGRYSLWFDDDRGHARIGAVLDSDDESVTRRLLGVDRGRLMPGHTARIGAWLHRSADALELPFADVAIRTPIGAAPAWHFPTPRPSSRWVIQVHGRGVQRQEGLRAVEPFRRAGFETLLISYRNDTVAPSSDDGMYALGGMEWVDVDAAMSYALDHGAESLVLMGWSMGGAIVLQTVTRSQFAAAVEGIVLESPVIDWVSTLAFHARSARLPGPIAKLAMRLLSWRSTRRLVRQTQPIDFAALDFVRRADELRVPVLLMHSDDDGYVPAAASAELAARRPDIVTYHRWHGAHHTRLWNYDPERWNAQLGEWLAALPLSRRSAREPDA